MRRLTVRWNHLWTEPNVSHPTAPTTADCAPLKPTPLRGLLGFGARLLDRELWPEDYRHNPLMVYFTGRRGGVLENLFIGFPWFFLGGVNIMIALDGIAGGEQGDLLLLLLLQIIIYPVLAGSQACHVVSWAARRSLNELRMEEILLTRLSPREIVHGLCVRPLAALALVHFAFMLNQFILLGAIVLTSIHVGPEIDLFLAMITFAAYFAVYFMMSIGAETGAAFGLRSALYIRRPLLARLRGVFDYQFSPMGFFSLLILGLLFFGLMIVPSVGMLVLVLVVVLASRSLADARDIITQCGNFPKFWWAVRDAREDEPRIPWLRLSWTKIFSAFREYERAERRLARPEDDEAGTRAASPDAPSGERP